jgi:alpha-mannosidase
LVSHTGPVDIRQAVEAGWAVLFPLQVCQIEGHQRGVLPARQASLWHVPAPLLASAFKRAEAGEYNEYILRLWNPTREAVTAARVRSDLLMVERARENDHAERDLGRDLPTEGGALVVNVAGGAMLTARLWLTPK